MAQDVHVMLTAGYQSPERHEVAELVEEGRAATVIVWTRRYDGIEMLNQPRSALGRRQWVLRHHRELAEPKPPKMAEVIATDVAINATGFTDLDGVNTRLVYGRNSGRSPGSRATDCCRHRRCHRRLPPRSRGHALPGRGVDRRLHSAVLEAGIGEPRRIDGDVRRDDLGHLGGFGSASSRWCRSTHCPSTRALRGWLSISMPS